MSSDDPYVYPGTNVPKNLFNERDKSKLDKREQFVTTRAIIDLSRNPVKVKFDGDHLREVHKRIFEKIYLFAGENRTNNMGKPESVLGGKTVKYGKAEFLDEMLGEPLETFKWDDNKTGSAEIDRPRSRPLKCGDWPFPTIRLQFPTTIRPRIYPRTKATLMKIRKQPKSSKDWNATLAEQVEALIGCIICGITMYISALGFTQMLAF